ncbi:hypothetical protein [Listeria floridensis]|uniref:hypothetical protein n=1 Tax=Listeria floridensis TaxID=1494962 RepID=UPI003B97E5E4
MKKTKHGSISPVQVTQLRNAGLHFKAIAKYMNCSTNTVHNCTKSKYFKRYYNRDKSIANQIDLGLRVRRDKS